MGGCMEVPKCCAESGWCEDEWSVVREGMAAWEEQGEEPEVSEAWWEVTVVMVVTSSSSSEISMSSPEE